MMLFTTTDDNSQTRFSALSECLFATQITVAHKSAIIIIKVYLVHLDVINRGRQLPQT